MKILSERECNEILEKEGLDTLVGHVRFGFGDGVLKVRPLDGHADHWIGGSEYLEFNIADANAYTYTATIQSGNDLSWAAYSNGEFSKSADVRHFDDYQDVLDALTRELDSWDASCEGWIDRHVVGDETGDETECVYLIEHGGH